jgi:hypothetical protein
LLGKKFADPENQGSLGVLDITVQNNALLIKNLHKFYNRLDIPWVNLIWDSYYRNDSLPGRHTEGSFWWKAHLKLLDIYKGMGKCAIGDGNLLIFGQICGMKVNAFIKKFTTWSLLLKILIYQ